MRLKDKVIIVTGAGRGIGKSLAEVLSHEGAKIFICSRNKEELKKVKEKIINEGGKCEYFVIDVTKKNQVDQFIDNILAIHKRIDIIINNAGYVSKERLIEDISDIEYETYFRTNVTSIFYFLRKVIPIMKKQNSGIILNISSAAGKKGSPKLSVYSASKFAVQGFTESVAKELARTNISCIAVCPGGVNTQMRAKVYGKEDAEMQQNPYVVANILRDVLAGKIEVPNGADIHIRDGKVTVINDNLKKQHFLKS